MGLVNEKIVLDFYLEQMEKDNIKFLQGRDSFKQDIEREILRLKAAEEMNEKIVAAKELWKLLFEASMSYIDNDKRGYDDLFKYFDEFVNFEELIFASDSFYRDHTLHCLWVYFLGEYLKKHDDFKDKFDDENSLGVIVIKNLSNCLKNSKHSAIFKEPLSLLDKVVKLLENGDSIRCISALTHDLGYPIKKINKINKCIKNILPYFAINNYDEFNFNYSEIQQNYINCFIEFITNDIVANIMPHPDSVRIKEIFDKVFSYFISMDDFAKVKNGKDLHMIIVHDDEISKLNKDELEILKINIGIKAEIRRNVTDTLRYTNDFEQYEHGIMSAFLLMKTLSAFNTAKFKYTDSTKLNLGNVDIFRIDNFQKILQAITNHTSSKFQINNIKEYSEFLIIIDELEEFSRISRANQNRQYVNEFCKTDISIVDDYLQVDFIFDNKNLEHLDPEFAFKNRCKRFLTLFKIDSLDEDVKIRLRCISKLPYDNNIYTLEISKKYANITINGEEQNIPKYLKSKIFYTKEEYMEL